MSNRQFRLIGTNELLCCRIEPLPEKYGDHKSDDTEDNHQPVWKWRSAATLVCNEINYTIAMASIRSIEYVVSHMR